MKCRRLFICNPIIMVIGLRISLFDQSSVGISADSFEVEGGVVHTYFGTDGVPTEMTNWFQVSVDGCKAVIRSGGMSDNKIQYFRYSCDGRNSALLVQYIPRRYTWEVPMPELPENLTLEPVVHLRGNPILNDALLIIDLGVIPEYGYGLISQVWLAYGSSCFLRAADPNHLAPIFSMGQGFRENHLLVRGKWELSAAKPYLPVWMVDFSDGYVYREDESILIKERLPSPFDNGGTNVLYSASSWTNVSNMLIPLTWRVIRYRPKLDDRKLEIASITEGHTARVRNHTSVTNFSIELPERTRIIDRTLTAKGFPLKEYVYNTTNASILSGAELLKIPNFRRIIKAETRTSLFPLTRIVISFLMLAVLGVPLALLINRRRYRDAQNGGDVRKQ